MRVCPLQTPRDRGKSDVFPDEEWGETVVVVGAGPATKRSQARRQRSLRNGAAKLSRATATAATILACSSISRAVEQRLKAVSLSVCTALSLGWIGSQTTWVAGLDGLAALVEQTGVALGYHTNTFSYVNLMAPLKIPPTLPPRYSA